MFGNSDCSEGLIKEIAMSTISLRPNLSKAAIIPTVALAWIAVLHASGQPPASTKKELAKEMIGTWLLAGTPAL
jgi:hypothetical protein